MKILFFIESLLSGGKERRLVELIKGLSTQPGIEMEIVLTKKEIDYEDILNIDIKIHYLIRSKPKDPKIFFKFYKIASKIKPDFIHVWGRMVAIYAIPTKLLLNIPMINNEITDASPIVLPPEPSLKLTFRFSDKLISNSLAGLKAYDAPSKKSTVIYNGFDFDRIKNLVEKSEIRNKFNIKTKNVIAMVASFSENKDYATFINAAKMVLENNKDVTFLCIGGGAISKYQNMVSKEYRENILFLGRQKDVESIMNVCDIGILTSNAKIHGEGISNALMEFMALGKPVIANDCGGTKELIKNNINGYLFDNDSYEDLSRKIFLILNDSILMKNLGNKSKDIVVKKFGLNNMINSFKLMYSEFQ